MPLKLAADDASLSPADPNTPAPPPRAAYSHSASLGSRTCRPMILLAAAQNFWQSVQLTHSHGSLSWSGAVWNCDWFGPPTSTHWACVTSNLPAQNGLAIVTVCRGPSLASRSASASGEPIVNFPAGTRTNSSFSPFPQVQRQRRRGRGRGRADQAQQRRGEPPSSDDFEVIKPASEVRRRPGSDGDKSGSSAYLRTGLLGQGVSHHGNPHWIGAADGRVTGGAPGAVAGRVAARVAAVRPACCTVCQATSCR